MSKDKKKSHSANSTHKVKVETEIKVPPHHHDNEHRNSDQHHSDHSHNVHNEIHVHGSGGSHSSKKSNKNIFIIAIVILVIAVLGYVVYLNSHKVVIVAEESDTVSVLYTGRLDTGEVFDTNEKDIAMQNSINRTSFDPLQFKVGAGQMIKGFDTGVVGMKLGERKNITIAPESAYGIYKSELVQAIPRANFTQAFPDVTNLTEGMRLSFYYNQRAMSLAIKSFDKDFVTVDFNHPLAGKTLYFEIKLINVTKAPLR